MANRRVAIVGVAPVRHRKGRHQDPMGAPRPGSTASHRRRGADQGGHRRSGIQRARHAAADRDRRVHGHASDLDRLDAGRWGHVGGDGRPRGRRHRPRPRRRDRARVRIDDACRPEEGAPHREPLVRRSRADPVRGPVRSLADREVRHVGPPSHARVRHHDRTTRRGRGVGARTTRSSTPTPTTATRSRWTTCCPPR